MSLETIRHPDGRVEVVGDLSASPLFNHDLAPVPVKERTWTTYNYAALWIAMAHCIPTYMLAEGLLKVGMSWGQAIFTVLLGNLIVLVPILLNSHPGTKYGIPFPVFARASYGVFGANLPAIMRALVACGWFGINAWIGGQAVDGLLHVIWHGWDSWGGTIGGYTPGMWIGFLIFWAFNILIVYRGMETLRHFENWSAPFVLVMTAGLLFYLVQQAHGLGPIMSTPGTLDTWAKFMPVFIPALTAMIGFWATLSLNMPDFTRYGASQRGQLVGQVVGLPTTMALFSMMGVIITSAGAFVFHDSADALWGPVGLVSHLPSGKAVALGMLTIVIATISVNVAANTVSPANDFSNAWPQRIDFKTGGLMTGILGIVIQPWRLLADPKAYIFDWLGFYSGGLAAIAGVLIVDYWLVRRTELKLPDLYQTGGCYRYARGWNWAAIAATLAGCFAAWGGRVIPVMAPLVPYGWFAGFFAAGLVYYCLPRTLAAPEALVAPAMAEPTVPAE
ncbi:MAG TPA: NCS1 family nucleobase:cation symporter-1 [Oscillatoriaceae cyanobacterium]